MNENKYCKCGCGEPLKNHKNTYILGHSNRSKEVQDKKKMAYISRYGVDNPSKSCEIKIKKEETNLKKYGVRYAAQNLEIQQRTKENFIDKYGTDNPSKNIEIRKKISEGVKKSRPHVKETIKRKLLDKFYTKLKNSDRLKSIIPLFDITDYDGVQNKYPFKCSICNNEFTSDLDDGKIPRCFVCLPKIETKGQSIIENELIQYIKKYEHNIIEQDREIIKPMELDVVIPDKNIAIELDGLYWHSEMSGKKSKFYHYQKSKLAENLGYRLIHIFEDEWVNKQKIVKTRLKNILGHFTRKIYARKCIIKEISKDVKNKFLQKYHIQGNDKSNVFIGLFYKNRLVSVMTFSPKRIALGYNQTENEWELVRFCSVSNFSIIGAASKMLKFFERTRSPKKIITYADKRWSKGNVYINMGFQSIGSTLPGYWYIIGNERKHRYGYRKDIIKNKLKIYDETLTEWENMQLNGLDRIWDCGHLKFEKIFPI